MRVICNKPCVSAWACPHSIKHDYDKGCDFPCEFQKAECVCDGCLEIKDEMEI